ncbi:dipeptide/oligopeptide/nickel ABC transporter ATPase/permease [Amycolatopsis mediterranei S699]|uniref:ATPase and permease components of ABC-type dipeptide/oligopeptide/nickel transport system n=2 Tax=Amycolatopsis mediterranei TaxID=33910 RepID=A0A0H3D2S8_AMYMU|nr:dipeptide/oligopeptide/nickel ABC transporter permease/ATP-binding protein [Amycolatopsis mediterranei]ADJ45250.1 ATPase and permease components of ABC-type dipeptide/oligopeptide/nickel transport system [Amycolatopsis mediterranei U32]AFO76961.1 dipeptide/oligopeptide/nickel ABC transporter ATPase/permease [Amycolatopsis mediterranei S699]AGT84089.1 dipeptide/oligopeptide/nickel ABC transporter ATPase/permease [Amycolatopsis mediterranei RB]KDO08535.1 peptide ABC transporter ATPase [Amycola
MARRGSVWTAAVRTPVGTCSAVLLALVVVLSVLAPLLWGDGAAAIDTDAIGQGPSGAHPFGTDSLGRDLLLRTLVATRLSVGLAVLATAIGAGSGVVLGTLPSVLPRRLGRLLTAVVDIAVAFPGLLLALFLAVIFGVGTHGAVLAIGFATAPAFARLVQTLSASVSGRDFVAAARIAGVGRVRLLARHVLPNIGEPLVVNATIGAGSALLAFAGLSFLGIGVQAPDYDWGRLLREGLDGIYVNPAAALAPAAAVVLAGLAFNLVGETVAAVVGVRTRTTRRGAPPAPATRPALPEQPADAVLVVENLRVAFPGPDGWTVPVRGVSFSVRAGEAIGVVGESGSGKSLTALAVSRLVEAPGAVTADRLEFAGKPLAAASDRELGTALAMVFQDPMTSFNPARRVGGQLAEVSEQHHGLSRRAAFARAVDRLAAVRIPAAERRARQYPHEFSGGMRQRAMIGMGLMGRPKLIVADEPTTALDVTVQRQVLRLLARTRETEGAAILLISHDIAVVSQTCERMLVMYAGRIVEDLPTGSPARHPYTRALLATTVDLETDRDQPLEVIPGRPPEPDQVPAGCAFAARCPLASERCRTEDPVLEATDRRDHRVACWHPQVTVLSGQSREEGAA